MSSRQTTGEVRLDGKQFVRIPCRNSGFGRLSAILGSGGGLLDRAALSKAENSWKAAPEPGPIRRIPVQTMVRTGSTNFTSSNLSPPQGSWGWIGNDWPTNPYTGVAWTTSDLSAAYGLRIGELTMPRPVSLPTRYTSACCARAILPKFLRFGWRASRQALKVFH